MSFIQDVMTLFTMSGTRCTFHTTTSRHEETTCTFAPFFFFCVSSIPECQTLKLTLATFTQNLPTMPLEQRNLHGHNYLHDRVNLH